MLKFTGILALFIYLFLVGLLFYYFNHHSEKKNIHFVKKNSERISVSIPAPKSKTDKSNPRKKSTDKKSIKKRVSKPKKIVEKKKKKIVKKKIVKKKIVKKKSIEKKVKKRTIEKSRNRKQQKAKVSNLFDKIGDKKPSGSKNSQKRKKDLDRGILNVYLANLEDILQGWSAQSEFAGESAMIWLKINRDGSFKFKLISPSNNQDFNSGLIQYLKQLQKIGFDPHKNSRPYELEITFVAKE